MKWFYTKVWLIIILGVLLCSILYVAFFKINIEKLPSWHVPVMIVGGDVVWLDDAKAIINVLMLKNNLSKKDAFDYLIGSYKEQYLIKKTAEKENIKPIALNDTDVLNNKEASELAENMSNEIYGWPMQKFKRLVIDPLELKRGVVNWYYQKNNTAIKEALLLIKNSQDPVVAIQNDLDYKYLGFIELTQVEPLIQLSILNQQPNSVSDIIETETAYNLVYLQSALIENGIYEVGLLSYKKNMFSEWLNKNLQTVFILSLIK